MEVILTDSYDELSSECSSIIIDEMKRKSDIVIGFATGSSPIQTYKNLIRANQEGIISFRDVITYNLDEYVGLKQSHKESYYRFMQDNLFSLVDVNQDNIHFPIGTGEDLEKNVDKYNNELSKNTIDVQILGIGGNGHIAFNEPNTSFESITHIVELDENTRKDNKRFFNNLDEVPTHAITMGIKNIMSAKKLVVLASGENKAKAVKELLEGYKTEAFPASILLDHDDVILIVDSDAASLLDK